MKIFRFLLDKMYSVKFLNKNFKPVLNALDEALFGTDKTTNAAPHIADGMDIKRFMSMVIISLMPAVAAAVYFYGIKALLMIIVSYSAGGAVEVIFAIVRKKEIHEGFLVTGLIFPLTLSPETPLWVVAVGVMFGTLFGKEIFGGTGRNIFNPALVGRLFITIAFPGIMSAAYKVPFTDVITTATPLLDFKNGQAAASYLDLLLGRTAGSMGEVFRIGIVAGGLYLIYSRVSNWRIPLFYLSAVFVLSYFGNMFFPDKVAEPVFQLLSGGLLFGAFFMASDPVTSPYTKPGKIIFAVLCGLLTVLIRSFSGYVEGVMFSIVIMNGFSPLIDRFIVSFKYRAVRVREEK
jgi:RnfABCDGE-type electron transport complex D subunit